jgi:ankyrin repeat protein
MHTTLTRASIAIFLVTGTHLCASLANDRLENFVITFADAHPAAFNQADFWQELHAALVNGADLATIDLNIQNRDTGVTMLHCTARVGDVELVQALLDAGADQHLIDTIFYYTPLHFAALNGHAQVIDLLCSSGAHINTQDKNRQTAMHHAATKGHYAACQALIAHGASSTITDRFGKMAIDYARARGYDAIVELLS